MSASKTTPGAVWLNTRISKGKLAGHQVQRLLGFWVIWHSYGGMQELERANIISRTGVYVQRAQFREVFGVDVREFAPDIAWRFAPMADPALGSSESSEAEA